MINEIPKYVSIILDKIAGSYQDRKSSDNLQVSLLANSCETGTVHTEVSAGPGQCERDRRLSVVGLGSTSVIRMGALDRRKLCTAWRGWHLRA